MNALNETEVKRRFNDHTIKIEKLFNKYDELRDEVKGVKSLAEHAGKGFVEMSLEIRALNKTVTERDKTIALINKKLDRVIEQNTNNLKWVVGIFVTFISIAITIIKLL